MALCIELAENLISNGLQPFIYKASNKKGHYNDEYYKTNDVLTLGNTKEVLDYKKYFHLDEESHVGIFLKNTSIRETNKGFFFLDFDLKGTDNISVFDDIVEKLKDLGCWEQVETKRNGNGYHLCLKANPKDITKLESQGKIYRGESSFVEILTAGKFLRLCPNMDYIIDNTEGKYIKFENVKTIKLEDLLSLSCDIGTDKILKKSIKKRVKNIIKANIDFMSDYKTVFDDEDKNMILNYIASKKMEYDEALKMTCGLGALHWYDVFSSAIPSEKIKEYSALFEKSMKNNQYHTRYMKALITALRVNRDKKVMSGKYLDIIDIEKILLTDDKKHLVIAPTGTGKTFTFLHAAKKLNKKVIFTVPNVAVVHQFGTQYDFISVSHSNISFEKAFYSSNILVCTIDKLANCPQHIDLSEHVIINDERHAHVTSADFRTEAVHFVKKVSERAKRIIDVTATPEPLHIKHYDNNTFFHKDDSKIYDVNVYVTKKRTQNAVRLLRMTDNEKRVVLNNDISFNETYSKTNKNFVSLDSSKKQSDVYNYLTNKNLIPESIKTVFTTDLFSAGLNINNKGEWHVIIIGFKDPAIIKQFVARFRNVDNIKVSIIISESDVKEVDLDGYADFLFEMANKRLEELNLNTDTAIVKEKGILQDDFFVLIEDLGKYEIVYDKILNNAWKHYVKHISPEDLMICFDEGSYTLNVHHLNETEYEDEILEQLKETRGQRKIFKESIKESTLDLLEIYQDLSAGFKNDKNYNSDLIDRYLFLTNEYSLPHITVMRFCRDDDFDYAIRFRIMANLYRKKNSASVLRKNKIYTVTKYVHRLRPGTVFNITELAEKKKFKRLDFKRCIESLWIFEEFKDKQKRSIKLIELKKDKILPISEQKTLLLSGYILDKKTALKML